MENFLEMDGYQFEVYISNLFRNLGFEVEATNYSNDGGIDLVATYTKPIFSGKYIIQCKNWTGSVGQPEVRDLYGVVMDQRANKGILITPSEYTQQAYEFAKGKNIELINGTVLRNIVNGNLANDAKDNSIETCSFRNDRYLYYQKNITAEPNIASNYLQMIDYLRGYVIAQDAKACTVELFDDIIEWTNKMINRCFKTPSKSNDKEMALMFIVEAHIHSGRLAEATEMLLKCNRFWIKDYCTSDRTAYRSHGGEYNGFSYNSIYAWNLYAAYKYVNYNRGCNLIDSKINRTDKEFSWLSYNLLNQQLCPTHQFGSLFIYGSPRWTTIGNGKTKHLSTTIFFSNELKDPAFFFNRFYKKSPDEYAREIDAILKIHGII